MKEEKIIEFVVNYLGYKKIGNVIIGKNLQPSIVYLLDLNRFPDGFPQSNIYTIKSFCRYIVKIIEARKGVGFFRKFGFASFNDETSMSFWHKNEHVFDCENNIENFEYFYYYFAIIFDFFDNYDNKDLMYDLIKNQEGMADDLDENISKGLKELGFKWASKKKMWYYGEMKGKSHGEKSIDEIKDKYGSKTFKKKENEKIAI